MRGQFVNLVQLPNSTRGLLLGDAPHAIDELRGQYRLTGIGCQPNRRREIGGERFEQLKKLSVAFAVLNPIHH
jgi:hypothetical protein